MCKFPKFPLSFFVCLLNEFIYWLSWVFPVARALLQLQCVGLSFIAEASLAAECSRVHGLPKLQFPGS